MHKYDAVLFDFDGTVVDTGEGILNSLVYALESMGVPVPGEEKLREFIGPPIYDSFITNYGADETTVFEYIKKYRERYFTVGKLECELYEGVVNLLSALRGAGIKTGIASSKPEKLIYEVMNHLGITELFDCVCGTSLDETKHTSKAELIAMAMEKLGIQDKSRVLMVGDRCFDIDGAAKAGVESVGVLYGYGSLEELQDHNATFMVETAEDIAIKVVFYPTIE